MKRCLERLRAVVSRCGPQQLGAVSIEYVGLAMVAATIVGGIYLSLNGGMTPSVNQALGQAAISFDGPGGSGVGIGAGGGGGGGGSSPSAVGVSEMGHTEPAAGGLRSWSESTLDAVIGFFRNLLGFGGSPGHSGHGEERVPSTAEDGTGEQARGAQGGFGSVEHPVSEVFLGSASSAYYIKSGNLRFSGTAEPGQTLDIYVRGKYVGTVVAGDDGSWVWECSTADVVPGKVVDGEGPVNIFAQGANDVVVRHSLDSSVSSGEVYYLPEDIPVPHVAQVERDGADERWRWNACGHAAVAMLSEFASMTDPNRSPATVEQVREMTMSLNSSEQQQVKEGAKSAQQLWRMYSNGTTDDVHLLETLQSKDASRGLGFENCKLTSSQLAATNTEADVKSYVSAALGQGHPVVALVGLDMTDTTRQHWMVVTGMSDDGTTVMVRDSYRAADKGGIKEYRWRDLYRAWSATEGHYKGVEVAR